MSSNDRTMKLRMVLISLSVLHFMNVECKLVYSTEGSPSVSNSIQSISHSNNVHNHDWRARNLRYDGENCTIHKLDDKARTDCGGRGYTMNCGSLSLNQVPHEFPALNRSTDLTPPLCLLNMSHNHFHTLHNYSFFGAVNMNSTDVMWLYLYNCHIHYIESNAFMNFSSLVYLNLTGNHLTWPGGFGVGVFRPLINLKDINLYGNNIMTFRGLGQEMQYMKQLRGIFIDLCKDCKFGESFKNLMHLTNLSLSQISNHYCNAPTIYNDTFRYVPQVLHLFIGSCNISKIEANAFSTLKMLVKLDLSYNERLEFKGMNRALYGLRNSPTLKVLNVNHIHKTHGLGIKLKSADVENLQTLQALEVLHMDLNKIEVLDKEVPQHGFPNTLRNLTFSGNRLTYGNYMWYALDVKSVVHLDVSRQHLNIDPFFSQHFGEDNDVQLAYANDSSVLAHKCNCSKVLCLPENLESLSWRKSFIWLKMDPDSPLKPVVVCGANNLRKLDLSFNLISTWKFVVYGLQNVTDLDLSLNNCDEVSIAFFTTFRSLKRLNVSRNYLGDALNQINQSEQPILFKHLNQLEEIDLSYNKILYLHEDMFKNLTNIKRVNLGYNLLKNWNTSLESSRCLELLDLTNNKLNVLDEATTTYLESLITEPCYKEVVVDLSANPLDCACSHLHFLKWARDTRVGVKMSNKSDCIIEGEPYPLRYQSDLERIINRLESDTCKHEDKTWITWIASIVSVVGTGFLSAVSCFLVYKHRWKLRYLYYTRHRRHVLEGYDRLFQYDAFISYAKTFGSFMNHSAVPMLQDIHNLTTWVYDKDSIPGVSMAENITHAINNSKKVVLLLNRDFLNDSWCEYETHMAYVESITTKRKMIIIVNMEQIAMEELPQYLQTLMKTEPSVEYPQHGQDENTFWMNLAEEISA